MSKKTLIRLLKTFVLSSVAVYTFMNGPNLYAQASYWLQNIKSAPSVATSESFAAIRPVRLPLSALDVAPAMPTTSSLPPLEAPQPLPNSATLTIPKINVSVPIVFGVSSDPNAIYDNLLNGVVHYSLTPKPGLGGASIILCHSSLYVWQYAKSKVGAPCALIGKLAVGDRFTVKYSDGRTFNYVMARSLVFDPLTGEDDKRVGELEMNPRSSLILVACWPINSTSHRIAIQAELE